MGRISLMNVTPISARPAATASATSLPPLSMTAFLATTSVYIVQVRVIHGPDCRIGDGDARGIDHRALERISRRHIAYARAVADDDTKADAAKVGAATAGDIAGLLELAHQ